MIPLYIWPLFALALLAVSSAGVVLQELSEIPPLLRGSWRMQATSVVLLPLFVWQLRQWKDFRITQQDLWILLGSSVCLALHFGLWVWSLDHTSLVHSLLFVTSHPLVVVALMPLLGQPVRRGHLWGTLLGLLGALITLQDAQDDGTVTLIGDLAAFGGAVTVVGYLLAGHHLRAERQWPIFLYAFPVTSIAGIWLGLVAWAWTPTDETLLWSEIWTGWWHPAWLLAMAYIAVGPGLCGHTGLNTVMRYLPPLVVSVGLLLEPLLGGLIGWIWRGEASIGFWTLLGAPVLLAGAFWVTWTNARATT